MCACLFSSRYSIDRNTDLERFFNVDALSGVISTAKALDREANSVHNLTIFAIETRKFTYSTNSQIYYTSQSSQFPEQQLSNYSLATVTRHIGFVRLC